MGNRPWFPSGKRRSFAIFKESHPVPNQVQIPLRTMISIAPDYENSLNAGLENCIYTGVTLTG